jgi:hypothetical protein
MSKITASEKLDVIGAEELPRWLTIFLSQVKNVLNNGITPQDNWDGQIVSVTFSSADTDTLVSTRLRRIPTGYIVLSRDAALTVYDGDLSSSVGNIYLRASATGTARILVF